MAGQQPVSLCCMCSWYCLIWVSRATRNSNQPSSRPCRGQLSLGPFPRPPGPHHACSPHLHPEPSTRHLRSSSPSGTGLDYSCDLQTHGSAPILGSLAKAQTSTGAVALNWHSSAFRAPSIFAIMPSRQQRWPAWRWETPQPVNWVS